jgi:predicted nucleotidyltransferase component of viral defense system
VTAGRRPRRGLDPAEAAAVRDRFGVADSQVLRDHAISHVLAALSAAGRADALLFIGGTALSRTHLPDRDVTSPAFNEVKRQIAELVHTAPVPA